MVSQPPYGYINPSVAEYSPANPTAPASTSAYKMQGLGSLITPATPASNILCLVNAVITAAATTAAYGLNLQLYYGPMVAGVAAPANAAAIPGSAIALGPVVTYENGTTLTAAADSFTPIMFHGLAKALVPGQQYWFDVAAESIGAASDNALTNVNVSLIEIG